MMAFIYTLVVGSLKSQHYVAMLNAKADEAELELKKSGKIRVIAQDNGSIHLSKYTQKHWAEWRAKGLYLFVCVQGSGRSIARIQPPAHVTNRGMSQPSLTAVLGIRQ